MPWNPHKWGALAVPTSLNAITPDDVVNAALATAPEFIHGASHTFSVAEPWDYTFYAYYRVHVNGWYISLAVHWHIRTTHPAGNGRGRMFIPGFANWNPRTRMAFQHVFPLPYNAATHVHGWSNNQPAQDARFTGTARYPNQVA
jgi:hypothetical protein